MRRSQKPIQKGRLLPQILLLTKRQVQTPEEFICMLDHSHLCFKRTFHALSAATVLCFRSCSNTIYIFSPLIILTYKATILDARPLFFFRKGKQSRPPPYLGNGRKLPHGINSRKTRWICSIKNVWTPRDHNSLLG